LEFPPIFAVEPSAWARWKGILIENITKNKKNNTTTITTFYFLLGSLKMELSKKRIFNIFQAC
jgi:hypothetical protein